VNAVIRDVTEFVEKLLQVCFCKQLPEIYSNLSGNFRKFVKYFFHFIIFNYNHIKKLKISMFY